MTPLRFWLPARLRRLSRARPSRPCNRRRRGLHSAAGCPPRYSNFARRSSAALHGFSPPPPRARGAARRVRRVRRGRARGLAGGAGTTAAGRRVEGARACVAVFPRAAPPDGPCHALEREGSARDSLWAGPQARAGRRDAPRLAGAGRGVEGRQGAGARDAAMRRPWPRRLPAFLARRGFEDWHVRYGVQVRLLAPSGDRRTIVTPRCGRGPVGPIARRAGPRWRREDGEARRPRVGEVGSGTG